MRRQPARRPYRGPAVRCCYCVYEADSLLLDSTCDLTMPLATVEVGLGASARQLCEEHALRGRWTPSYVHPVQGTVRP